MSQIDSGDLRVSVVTTAVGDRRRSLPSGHGRPGDDRGRPGGDRSSAAGQGGGT
ncbi:hypothetical protein [Streptomyces sp. enrichment culture]|uniref:hypothetical protein n=1 Tax=Streptomyces sp. enrichment culture TaxID=1795815 RepID=UPI003F5492FC